MAAPAFLCAADDVRKSTKRGAESTQFQKGAGWQDASIMGSINASKN